MCRRHVYIICKALYPCLFVVARQSQGELPLATRWYRVTAREEVIINTSTVDDVVSTMNIVTSIQCVQIIV